MGIIATGFAILVDVFGPQRSLYATDIREYKFSYRKYMLGPLQYFLVSATSQAEADMLAACEMRERVKNQGALQGSLRNIRG